MIARRSIACPSMEAGTPNIAGVIGLGAAVRWVQGSGS